MGNPLFDALEKTVNQELVQGGGLKPWTPRIAESFHSISIRTLIEDDYYLNLKGQIYPYWVELIENLEEERKQRKIEVVVIEAGIGSGKSFITSALLWTEWFRFTTISNPKEVFPHIDPETVRAFILMSRTADQARRVVFTNVYRMFQSQFNREYFPPDPKVRTSLNIPRNKTLIFPGTGEAASALGYNLYAAIIDEANFLENVAVGSSSAEVPDQCQAMYDQVSGRIYSRFGDNGGLIFFISSANRTKSWMEKKIIDAIKHGSEKDKIYFKRIPIWKAKPAGFFPSGQKFLFNPSSYEIITDPDMIQEFFAARDRLQLSSDMNKFLGGLLI